MPNILIKEIKLSAHILSFIFILFGLMFFLPGYPILCGAFFTCLGLYQSFQNTRETNDIVFSSLLPVSKMEIVKGKYLFCCLIEMCSFLLMFIATLIRMFILKDAKVYTTNFLMNANLFALSLALVVFSLFNLIFVDGFFETIYKIGKPFIIFVIVNFIFIGLGETLHHIPGLESLNTSSIDYIQLILFILGITIYIILTLIAYRKSINKFERIDL